MTVQLTVKTPSYISVRRHKFSSEKVAKSYLCVFKLVVEKALEPETFEPDDSTEETLETLQQVRESMRVFKCRFYIPCKSGSKVYKPKL